MKLPLIDIEWDVLKDFKKHDNYYVAGPVGEFYEVPENGELKHDIFKDVTLVNIKRVTGELFKLVYVVYLRIFVCYIFETVCIRAVEAY